MSDPRYGKTRIGRTSGGVFVSNAVSVVLAFSNSIFLTRTLGVTGRGEFAVFSASFGVLTLMLGFGLDTSIRYHIAKGRVATDHILSSLVVLVLLVGGLVFGTAHLTHALFESEIFLPAAKQTVRFELVLAGVVASNLFYAGIASVFAGSQRFTVLNVGTVAFSALSVVAFGTLFWLKTGSMSSIGSDEVFMAYLGLQLFNAVVLGFVAYRVLGLRWSAALVDRQVLGDMLRYATMTYVASLAQFLNYRFDVWIIQYFEGSGPLGLYSLAANLAMMLWILPRSTSSVLLPAMASDASDVSMAQSARVARLLMLLTILVAVPIGLTSPWWLPFLYGAEFAPSAIPFALLLTGCAPFALCVIQAGVLAGIDRVDVNLAASTLGLATTVVLDLLLIPRYGIAGAAAASAASYLVTTAYLTVQFARIGSLPLLSTFVPERGDLRYLIDGFKSLLR